MKLLPLKTADTIGDSNWFRIVEKMHEWSIEKKLKKPDGKEYVEFRKSADAKLYCFHVLVWKLAEEDEILYHPKWGYWTLLHQSGYYASLKECEKAARTYLGWL